MVKDQLFKEYPTTELVKQVLNAFGLRGLDDNTPFSRADLHRRETVSNLTKLKPYLEKCYIPCKARTYLNNLTEKNVITILRQILKHLGYTVFSKEKYMRGNKFIIYHIDKKPSYSNLVKLHNDELKKLEKDPEKSKIEDNKPIIITFN